LLARLTIPYPCLAVLSAADYGVMVVYLLAVLAIGLWFSRGQKDTESYLLGGRAVPWLLVGVSYVMSLLSTITLVSVPGEAYEHGLALAIGSVVTPIFAVLSFSIFVRFYFYSRVFTPFDYLERRFDARIRAIAAGFFWIARVVYIGLVLYASAGVFAAAAGWDRSTTIFLVGAIGIACTLLGGQKAVVSSEFLNFLVLVTGIFLILDKAVPAVSGGVWGVFHTASENGRLVPELSDPGFYGLEPRRRVTLFAICAGILNEQMFFNSSDQVALQRLLSTSGYAQARRSLFASATLLVPVLCLLWFIGLSIFAFYRQLPAEQRPTKGDMALFHFIATELPSPLPGLILSAMLAAVMSTLSAAMNSLATVATKDFYHRFFHPAESEARQVVFSRWMTLATGILAMGIGLALSQASQSIGATVMETTTAWLCLSVALPPVFLFGMLSRRATARDALIQLIVGWVTTAAMLGWYYASQKDPRGGISFMVVGFPGPVLSLATAYALSRRQPRRSDSELKNLTFWTISTAARESER
jgi:SSS family transporter